MQATKALLEADAWPGPSLVIAYSTCIAHGINMATSMSHQKDAVRSGYWPLYRFQPSDAEHGIPFKLDSKQPSMPVAEFIASEARFAVLARTHPERAERLIELAQADVDERWRYYSQLGTIERTVAARVAWPRRRSRRSHRRQGGLSDAHLETTYLGLTLRSPIVASAGPLTGDPDTACASPTPAPAPSCCPSLFEEEIIHEQVQLTSVLEAGAEHFAEAIDYFPAIPDFPSAVDRYLANLERIKAACHGAGDRQPQCLDAGRMGPLRRAARRRRRRRHRAQRLPGRRRSDPPTRNRSSTTTSPSSPT